MSTKIDLMAVDLSTPNQQPEPKVKTYVNVSYSEKEIAKQCGAKWDPDEKKWFTYESKNAFLVKFVKAQTQAYSKNYYKICQKR